MFTAGFCIIGEGNTEAISIFINIIQQFQPKVRLLKGKSWAYLSHLIFSSIYFNGCEALRHYPHNSFDIWFECLVDIIRFNKHIILDNTVSISVFWIKLTYPNVKISLKLYGFVPLLSLQIKLRKIYWEKHCWNFLRYGCWLLGRYFDQINKINDIYCRFLATLYIVEIHQNVLDFKSIFSIPWNARKETEGNQRIKCNKKNLFALHCLLIKLQLHGAVKSTK